MKPILLRVLTDLYVSAETHSADEIAQFQEIGGTLAGQVDTETACVVACKLSAYAGTPPGVGCFRKPQRWLQVGESCTVEIEKLGSITNTVVADNTV